MVMKMPGSSGMWGLSIPPAMLKPRPELPCGKPHAAPVPRGHLLAGSAGLRAASPPAAPPLQHPPWSGRAAGAWLRGGRRSSARALGAEHPTDGAGAWEPPGPPSPPRLCRETEAGSERGGRGGGPWRSKPPLAGGSPGGDTDSTARAEKWGLDRPPASVPCAPRGSGCRLAGGSCNATLGLGAVKQAAPLSAPQCCCQTLP